MKNKRAIFLAAGLAAALAVGNAAWSASPADELGFGGRGFGRHGGPGMGPMLADPGLQEQLGLTEQQATELRRMFFDHARAGVRQRAEVRALHLELQELLAAEEVDRAAVDETLRQISDARHALLKSRIEQRLGLREVLSPEQRQQWRHLMRERMKQRFMHRRGLRGPHGPRRGPGGLGREGGYGPDFDIEPAEPPLE